MIYKYDLTTELNQCDIFQNIEFNCESNLGHFAILLTPICDLILHESRRFPKAQYIKFAAIVRFDKILFAILSQLKITKKQRNGEEPIDQQTYNDFITLLKNVINGSIYPRYFYVPPLEGYFNHSIIDYQLLEIKKYSEDLFEELKKQRIAQIASSWREAIPVRYSSYASRIGIKDISEKVIDRIILDYSLDLTRSS